MKFFIPVPVPKIWEWAEPFPFPFPNDQKSFPLTPGSALTIEKYGWCISVQVHSCAKGRSGSVGDAGGEGDHPKVPEKVKQGKRVPRLRKKHVG